VQEARAIHPPGPLGRDIERRVARQDRCLQLLQARPRIEPELLGQPAPELLENVERLGLAAAAIQGEHQLHPKALAQWVLLDESGQLTNELLVTSE
jgi:hypothetical protein